MSLAKLRPHQPGQAAWALGEIGSERCHRRLRRALDERDLSVIASAHEYYIRQGIPDSEPLLIEAFPPDRLDHIVPVFLHSRNPTLIQAATDWLALQADGPRVVDRNRDRFAPAYRSISRSRGHAW